MVITVVLSRIKHVFDSLRRPSRSVVVTDRFEGVCSRYHQLPCPLILSEGVYTRQVISTSTVSDVLDGSWEPHNQYCFTRWLAKQEQ